MSGFTPLFPYILGQINPDTSRGIPPPHPPFNVEKNVVKNVFDFDFFSNFLKKNWKTFRKNAEHKFSTLFGGCGGAFHFWSIAKCPDLLVHA